LTFYNILALSVDLMKFITETRHVYFMWYLRFYYKE